MVVASLVFWRKIFPNSVNVNEKNRLSKRITGVIYGLTVIMQKR